LQKTGYFLQLYSFHSFHSPKKPLELYNKSPRLQRENNGAPPLSCHDARSFQKRINADASGMFS
ncbi:MAG: hypothetical protein J6N18_14900, partial [Kiritimatiellae bacterium]|nr:hypothetical protein [Kiritimatiellia bacterium]